MTLTIRSVGALRRGFSLLSLMAVSIILLILPACGGSKEATGDAPTSTAAGETPIAGDSLAADSPTSTSITEAPDTSRVSLDEYLAICGIPETEAVEAVVIALNEVSKSFRDYTERLESVEPPLEVAAWHHAVLPYQKAFRKSVDEYLDDPGEQSQDEFLLSMTFSLASRYQPVIDQAILDMDSDVRAQMSTAGCIDEDTAEAIQMQEEREEIPVGGSVKGKLEESDRTDTLQFQAEMEQKYLIEVIWEGPPEIYLLIKDPPDPVVTSITMLDSRSSPLVHRWTAPKSGTFYVDVNAVEGAGSYTISVVIDTSPNTPAGVSAAWEGSAIKVSWEPAKVAEYYSIYYDDRGPGCELDNDGNPRFCDELAVNVPGTNYVHTFPDSDANYYWVSACNSGGCSKIDSSNPTSP